MPHEANELTGLDLLAEDLVQLGSHLVAVDLLVEERSGEVDGHIGKGGLPSLDAVVVEVLEAILHPEILLTGDDVEGLHGDVLVAGIAERLHVELRGIVIPPLLGAASHADLGGEGEVDVPIGELCLEALDQLLEGLLWSVPRAAEGDEKECLVGALCRLDLLRHGGHLAVIIGLQVRLVVALAAAEGCSEHAHQ